MIDVEPHGNLTLFRMRHGKANALDIEFCEALTAACEAERHSTRRAVVLTGTGGIFSAGVDLKRALDGGSAYVARFLTPLCTMFETLFTFPKPVIAAVNGHAIAGGCVIACAVDYRLMAASAGRIGVPELLVGVPFPAIALEIMRSAVAPQHFATLLYSGATLDTAAALDRGLIDKVVAPDALLDQAIAVAQSYAALPAAAFALTKRQIRTPAIQRVRESASHLDVEARAQWEAPATLDSMRAYVSRALGAGSRRA